MDDGLETVKTFSLHCSSFGFCKICTSAHYYYYHLFPFRDQPFSHNLVINIHLNITSFANIILQACYCLIHIPNKGMLSLITQLQSKFLFSM